MKNKKLLTLIGSVCLTLVLAALVLPACAKEAPPPAPSAAEEALRAEIAELEEEVTSGETAASKLEARITELEKKRIEAVGAAEEAARAEIAELEKEVASGEAEASKVEARIAELEKKLAEAKAVPTLPTVTFTWADYTDWTEMDPSPAFSVETTWISQCYETLTHYNYPGKTPEVLPCLATSWDVSEDGLKWAFHLREGVKFHCGREFDAEAVKYSIDRTVEMGKGAAFIWASVESVEVIDKYTVELNLKYPAPIDIIASSGYAAYIMCPVCTEGKTSDWFWAGHDTGTGPYEIVKYEKGEYTILERFDDYWGGWEDNQIDRFVYKVVPESATRLKLLEAGEIDFTYNIAREYIPELMEAPGIVVKSFPTYLMSYAHLNCQKPPLDDVRVRQAIAYATPYKDIVDYVLMGYGQQGRGVIPRGMLGHSENCKQYNLDLDEARALLAEAGYPDGGFTLRLKYISGVGWDKLVEIWGAALEKVGITLEATGMPWSQQWSIATGPLEERQDICIYSWWPTYIDPYDFLGSMLHSEEEPIGAYSFHLTYYKNPEFDNLIDTANELIGYNREEALRLFDQAQVILMEDSPIIPLYDYIRVLPYQAKWTGISFNPAYDYVLPLYDIRVIR